jgi:hypothetical protein
LYADAATGVVKGQFKRPASGLDISLDCSQVQDSDSLEVKVKPWEINN